MAEKGSLPERYCLVLEELRVEAIRQAKHMHPLITPFEGIHDRPQQNRLRTSPSMLMGSSSVPASYTGILGQTTVDFDGMPSSAFSDSSGWGQFASMVSSGLGNLDLFLNDESFTL